MLARSTSVNAYIRVLVIHAMGGVRTFWITSHAFQLTGLNSGGMGVEGEELGKSVSQTFTTTPLVLFITETDLCECAVWMDSTTKTMRGKIECYYRKCNLFLTGFDFTSKAARILSVFYSLFIVSFLHSSEFSSLNRKGSSRRTKRNQVWFIWVSLCVVIREASSCTTL